MHQHGFDLAAGPPVDNTSPVSKLSVCDAQRVTVVKGKVRSHYHSTRGYAFRSERSCCNGGGGEARVIRIPSLRRQKPELLPVWVDPGLLCGHQRRSSQFIHVGQESYFDKIKVYPPCASLIHSTLYNSRQIRGELQCSAVHMQRSHRRIAGSVYEDFETHGEGNARRLMNCH